MSDKTPEQRINAIVAQQLNVNLETLTPETALVDVGADSLDFVEICMALEDEFKTELKTQGFIPESALEDVTTLGQLHTAVKGQLA